MVGLQVENLIAALVPHPRAHLTRYHGVFAPNFKHRLCISSAAVLTAPGGVPLARCASIPVPLFLM